MAEESISRKPKINMLSPIDNIFGTHEGRLGPTMIFLGVAVAPFLIYVFILMAIVPIKLFLIFEALWCIRFGFKIIGKENQKLADYRASRRNQYESSKSLIKISHCYSNGLVEYENGRISIIITGFTRTYFDDDVFSSDMSAFLGLLDKYTPDVYLHQVVEETNLQDKSENLRVYTDKQLMKQRMEIYTENDTYVNNNSKLWRYVFVVKAYKHNWKTTYEEIDAIVHSDTAKKVFFTLEIASEDEVSDVASRDICTYVSIQDMLREKFANDDYDDSKVLYYGDEVPEEFKEEATKDELKYRRVSFVDKDHEDDEDDREDMN